MAKLNRHPNCENKSSDTLGETKQVQEDLLRSYLSVLLETRLREADVSDGSKVPVGSKKHIEDLGHRIADLVRWRDKEKKGSESRANYTRLINKLRSQLKSAERIAEKQKEKKTSMAP